MSISVQGISKNFKGRRKGESDNQVLKDVSFEIEEGQFVCLLGPSGCGKTTTLTIVAGFQKPTEGIIEVNGNVVTKPGPDRAFMFQNYALFPWLKVGENIEYPMKKMKVPKEERKKKLKELLEMAQLTKYENYYIHEISGGMKQRVALLRALACDPKVLLMDEPLGAVDFQMRQLLQRQLEDILGQKKTTSLMVTHDVDESVYLSDRVIVMSRDHGKILEDLKGEGLTIFLTSHFMDEVEMLCDQIGILRDGMFVFEGTVKEAVDISPYSNLEDAYLWWTQEEENR